MLNPSKKTMTLLANLLTGNQALLASNMSPDVNLTIKQGSNCKIRCFSIILQCHAKETSFNYFQDTKLTA